MRITIDALVLRFECLTLCSGSLHKTQRHRGLTLQSQNCSPNMLRECMLCTSMLPKHETLPSVVSSSSDSDFVHPRHNEYLQVSVVNQTLAGGYGILSLGCLVECTAPLQPYGSRFVLWGLVSCVTFSADLLS